MIQTNKIECSGKEFRILSSVCIIVNSINDYSVKIAFGPRDSIPLLHFEFFALRLYIYLDPKHLKYGARYSTGMCLKL